MSVKSLWALGWTGNGRFHDPGVVLAGRAKSGNSTKGQYPHGGASFTMALLDLDERLLLEQYRHRLGHMACGHARPPKNARPDALTCVHPQALLPQRIWQRSIGAPGDPRKPALGQS